MKKLLALLFAVVLVPVTQAVTTDYNDTITAIYGNGNPDYSWTSVTDDTTGVQVAMRGKYRVGGGTPNDGAGTYTFPTGTVGSPARAVWNWEFSAFSGDGGQSLADYAWKLSVDTDPSQGTSFAEFNPFAPTLTMPYYADNALGTSSTANGGGTKQFLALSLDNYTLGQNSQNIMFAPSSPQDPNANATYTYMFAAHDGSTEIAKVSINVVVGSGGDPVPDAGSTAGLLGASFAGFIGFRRYMSRK